MKRYYILKSDMTCATDCELWYVVPTKAEPIGDNLFYRKRKWCGVDCLELYDTTTGVYICRKNTLEELLKYVASEEFKNQLERVRNSYCYETMFHVFNKAMREYQERIKEKAKNDQ